MEFQLFAEYIPVQFFCWTTNSLFKNFNKIYQVQKNIIIDKFYILSSDPFDFPENFKLNQLQVKIYK